MRNTQKAKHAPGKFRVSNQTVFERIQKSSVIVDSKGLGYFKGWAVEEEIGG